MGVEIPHVEIDTEPPKIHYGFSATNSQLDIAYISFDKAKHLTVVLSELENSVYRLANAIKKTQRRANALKNIIIPRFRFFGRKRTGRIFPYESDQGCQKKEGIGIMNKNKQPLDYCPRVACFYFII